MIPSPIIYCMYNASKWVPTTQKGRQSIPTVLPTLFLSPTLSNNPVRVSNTPCSHSVSVDVTSPYYP